jgi:hypothetical protein
MWTKTRSTARSVLNRAEHAKDAKARGVRREARGGRREAGVEKREAKGERREAAVLRAKEQLSLLGELSELVHDVHHVVAESGGPIRGMLQPLPRW